MTKRCKAPAEFWGANILQDVTFGQKFGLGGRGRGRVGVAEIVVGNGGFVGRNSEQLTQLALPRLHN